MNSTINVTQQSDFRFYYCNIQGAVQEEGGNEVHHQRLPILQPSTDLERGRRR